MEVEGLCLPKLAMLNIYLRCIEVPRYMQDPVPGFMVGIPFQGAMSVAITVRDLVAEEVMPALTQVSALGKSLPASLDFDTLLA